MAGCLFGFISLIVEPNTFGLTLGIGTVAASVLGGTESVYGIFIGAAILQLGPEKSVNFASWAPVVYGGFLIVAAIFLKNGIAGIGRRAALRLARRLEPSSVPETVLLMPEDATDAATGMPAPGLASGNGNGDGAPAEHDNLNQLSLGAVVGKRVAVQNISKSFGGVAALNDVSLTAEPGKVTALIGSNGSGKTTLLNVICGYLDADTGSVELDDRRTNGLHPHQVSRLGVGRTFQTPTIPRGVSVRDVVASGRYASDHIGFLASILRLPRYRRAQRKDRAEAMEFLRLAGIDQLADQEAASLPLGSRRLVEVARTLCAEPGVVLLDEPASGLNDEEVLHLADLIRAMAAAGATVIVIEHNFRFITSVAGVIHVLHLGSLIASGSPDEIAHNKDVIASYLGDASASDSSRRERAPAAAPTSLEPGTEPEPLLRLEGIESGYGDLRVLRGVSMSIQTGTIEVVLGRNGVGKTTLLSTLAGLLPLSKGSLKLQGQRRRSIYRLPPSTAGITLVQEGKRIFRQRSIWENVMLGTYGLKLSRPERQRLCREVLEAFPILRERQNERAGGLSGGQQQMLAIAQALAARPKILLLDEPSAGLAPSIVDELFARLRALGDDGLTILLVEQLADKALEYRRPRDGPRQREGDQGGKLRGVRRREAARERVWAPVTATRGPVPHHRPADS